MYTYEAEKERVHCPLKKDAKETLHFEDNLFFEAENPFSDMMLRDLLFTCTAGYHSTTKSHMKRRRMYVPINTSGFCHFNVKNQKVNQSFTTENKFLELINEPYDGNPLLTRITLKTSQLRNNFTGFDLNNNSELFSHEKRKKTVHRVSSFVMASIVFLSVAMEMCSQLSIIQLQPKSGPILFLSTILKLFGFMAYVSATAAMIVNGAPFPGMQSSMLMFWATFMLVNSAKSLTEVYLPLLGIIFTGCYGAPMVKQLIAIDFV
ncbi:uncharacterized protein HKW66_Vig0110970 [Vigna angularis]|uniref:Uncharacterized protein n=1 Tax=Phaseolus angularis TaxID=3914 RepID=A0A8T0L2E4_PHAAN|nr:uncharacterized protein HKW66_Vig0110970 [Vigna angularis]